MLHLLIMKNIKNNSWENQENAMDSKQFEISF